MTSLAAPAAGVARSPRCMTYRLALVGPALTLAACGTPAATPDAGSEVVVDAAPGPDAPWLDDGTPVRMACTSALGGALSAVHGRLDGYLVAIVPSTSNRCMGDSDHV